MSLNGLTTKDIEKLSAPFDDKTLGVKVQSFSKDRTRASLVCYLQHTDVYTRIESVDPNWQSQILSVDWVGEACFTRMRLTILGVSRENVGEGNDPKSSASDAIKRCAMLFGVGRYLYDAETVWVPYNEQQDRFRTWTLSDYRGALRQGQSPLPSAPAAQSPAPARPAGTRAPAPVVTPKGRTKVEIAQELSRVIQQLGMTDQQVNEWIWDEFKTTKVKMTLENMERFLTMLQCELGRKGA